ncbi:peptidoglycan DD-metalloendopeptidase family protein [Paenibacillus sp. LHD-38]|uniref:murein hydrolase activator EnvC family protein n=1 Tax=Paenibacillus sp. LHD-38 TaxID=3072143 RepID=UPI00281035C6|nr:peptidoglycan DD-metalloendopeptidase family protein [Paenibacillus sp. LHD-38]MDQ8733999.1 peptidoglycan DD-metalloendopeptidase family protein [Paenibacillus sp. LHD-38]
MKKRKWLLFIATMMLTVFVLQPTGGEAASLSNIKKQIAAAKAEMRAAEQRAAKAEREAASVHQQAASAKNEKVDIESKKTEAEASITNLMAEIDNVVINKTKTQAQSDAKEEELLQTGLELEQAEERVQTRDELLQSRMRLMYTNGFVSYMDVLLSATSFTDFIDRFDALQSILSQDRDILAEQRAEKELVALKKVEVEKQFAEVKAIYEKLELYEAHLVKKEQEKEIMIASYNSNIKQLNSKLQQIDSTLEELEGISEEQEALLMELAAKVSKLNAEKNRISNPYSGGKLGMPIKDNYRISSNFGTRVHPITGKRHTHTGMDFAAPQGTDIYAAEDGVVLVAQSWSSYGNCVIIDHGNGLWTLYGHIRNGGIKVEKGETVKKGQKIAEVGSTGNSTGPHLHFEVRKNQTPVNPSSYLK